MGGPVNLNLRNKNCNKRVSLKEIIGLKLSIGKEVVMRRNVETAKRLLSKY